MLSRIGLSLIVIALLIVFISVTAFEAIAITSAGSLDILSNGQGPNERFPSQIDQPVFCSAAMHQEY